MLPKLFLTACFLVYLSTSLEAPPGLICIACAQQCMFSKPVLTKCFFKKTQTHPSPHIVTLCVCVCVLVRTFKSYFLGKLSIQFIIKNCNHRFIHKTHRTNSSFKRKFVLFDLYFSISSTTSSPKPLATTTQPSIWFFKLDFLRFHT